jgi:hypothetical protein
MKSKLEMVILCLAKFFLDISLKIVHVQDKPDPGNQQREIEANKFNLKNSEKSLDANASNESDKSGSDLANEEKTHARYYPIRLLRAKYFSFNVIKTNMPKLFDKIYGMLKVVMPVSFSSFGMINFLDLARGLLLPFSVYDWLIQAVEDESSLGLR